MTLIVNLPDDQVAMLKAKAASAGFTLEAWFSELAAVEAGSPQSEQVAKSIVHLQESVPREWARQFRAWADGHDPNLPVLE
jgi:hypothetical protein